MIEKQLSLFIYHIGLVTNVSHYLAYGVDGLTGEHKKSPKNFWTHKKRGRRLRFPRQTRCLKGVGRIIDRRGKTAIRPGRAEGPALLGVEDVLQLVGVVGREVGVVDEDLVLVVLQDPVGLERDHGAFGELNRRATWFSIRSSGSRRFFESYRGEQSTFLDFGCGAFPGCSSAAPAWGGRSCCSASGRSRGLVAPGVWRFRGVCSRRNPGPCR